MSTAKLTDCKFACKFNLSCAFSKTLLVLCVNNTGTVRFIAYSLAGWNRAVICSLHMENNIGLHASHFWIQVYESIRYFIFKIPNDTHVAFLGLGFGLASLVT